MSNKVLLEIEVEDNARIKVKQFAEECKKEFNEVAGSAKNLSSACANLQSQFEKLISNVGIKNAFEDIGVPVKKAEELMNNLLRSTSDLHTKLAMINPALRIIFGILGSYIVEKTLDYLHSYIKGTRQFEEELRRLQERLERLHTPAKVLEFLREQQSLAAEQSEQLGHQIELLDRLTIAREALKKSIDEEKQPIWPPKALQRMIEWGIEIEKLSKEVDDAAQSLAAKIKIMIEAATKYEEMTSESRELRDELDKLRQKYEELERKFKDLEKEQSLMLQEQTRAEDRAIQAIYDGDQALEQLEDSYRSNLPVMIEFSNLNSDINQNSERFYNLAAYVTDGLKDYGVAVDGARQKQEDLNQTGRESISIFSGLLDVLGAFSGVLTALGINIGGAFQRVLSALSAIQNLINTVSRIAGRVRAGEYREAFGFN